MKHNSEVSTTASNVSFPQVNNRHVIPYSTPSREVLVHHLSSLVESFV